MTGTDTKTNENMIRGLFSTDREKDGPVKFRIQDKRARIYNE
jgi:hypothetical protein